MKFKGKVAIVTGASSGIGKSTAELFAREGASVLVADVTDDLGQSVADDICKSGGVALFMHSDVSIPEDCEKMVAKAISEWGRLDIACNNAGIAGEQAPTADYSYEGWQRLISVNLSSVFYCMKHEIKAMLKSGGGAIVNVSSILGQVAFATAPAYTAAKHGVVGLTRCTAVEYASQGIRINSIGPAFIHTPMIQHLEESEEMRNLILGMHPIGRLGKPEEVADLIAFLSSDNASFITGSYYPIDGGYLAK